MATKHKDQEFIEFIVEGLVSNPDDVKTTRTVDEMGVLITLKVNPEDMGSVIGRAGQTVRAIRTLARVVGAKNNARINLRIEEPEGGRRAPEVERSEGSRRAPARPAKKESSTEDDVDKAVEDLNL